MVTHSASTWPDGPLIARGARNSELGRITAASVGPGGVTRNRRAAEAKTARVPVVRLGAQKRNEPMAFSGDIPNELITAIAQTRSLALIGSGLSRTVVRSTGKPLPNWAELLRELLDVARFEDPKLGGLSTDIESAINAGKLTLVAQELSERVGSANLGRFLRDIFLDPDVKPTHTHRSLVEIPFRGILTTNYDTLIEGAYTLLTEGRIPPVITQEDLDRVPNPLRTKGEFVFKIHGDINRPDTIVLGSHDYQEALFRRPGYRSFLETAFTVNTVLFVGFGLEDPDLDNMLERLASIFSRTNDEHFALAPEGRFSALERRRLARDKRIRIIEYDNATADHAQVGEFLSFLSDVTAPAGDLRQEYQGKISALSRTATGVTSCSGRNADPDKPRRGSSSPANRQRTGCRPRPWENPLAPGGCPQLVSVKSRHVSRCQAPARAAITRGPSGLRPRPPECHSHRWDILGVAARSAWICPQAPG